MFRACEVGTVLSCGGGFNMSYQAVRTDDGIEIRDGESVIATAEAWPPRDPDTLADLFDDANVSSSTKDLLTLLFGVIELDDETTDQL